MFLCARPFFCVFCRSFVKPNIHQNSTEEVNEGAQENPPLYHVLEPHSLEDGACNSVQNASINTTQKDLTLAGGNSTSALEHTVTSNNINDKTKNPRISHYDQISMDTMCTDSYVRYTKYNVDNESEICVAGEQLDRQRNLADVTQVAKKREDVTPSAYDTLTFSKAPVCKLATYNTTTARV